MLAPQDDVFDHCNSFWLLLLIIEMTFCKHFLQMPTTDLLDTSQNQLFPNIYHLYVAIAMSLC